jgi:RNA polymerase sigma-70 factor (ECF subfamily)
VSPGEPIPFDADARRMLAFQRGDESAFDELYREWRVPLFRFAYRMLGRTGPAEEVAQETFVRLYQARERYRPTAAFRTYVLRIATHLCVNERRRASFRLEDGAGPAEVATADAGPAGVAEHNQLAAAVERALAALPERQRAAVVLARYEGCSMAEIGEVLEVSEGAAKLLVHRAREQLRTALAAYLPEEAAG